MLAWWNGQEKAPGEPEVTLALSDGGRDSHPIYMTEPLLREVCLTADGDFVPAFRVVYLHPEFIAPGKFIQFMMVELDPVSALHVRQDLLAVPPRRPQVDVHEHEARPVAPQALQRVARGLVAQCQAAVVQQAAGRYPWPGRDCVPRGGVDDVVSRLAVLEQHAHAPGRRGLQLALAEVQLLRGVATLQMGTEDGVPMLFEDAHAAFTAAAKAGAAPSRSSASSPASGVRPPSLGRSDVAPGTLKFPSG
mgnify:CR=1 FL=1